MLLLALVFVIWLLLLCVVVIRNAIVVLDVDASVAVGVIADMYDVDIVIAGEYAADDSYCHIVGVGVAVTGYVVVVVVVNCIAIVTRCYASVVVAVCACCHHFARCGW